MCRGIEMAAGVEVEVMTEAVDQTEVVAMTEVEDSIRKEIQASRQCRRPDAEF